MIETISTQLLPLSRPDEGAKPLPEKADFGVNRNSGPSKQNVNLSELNDVEQQQVDQLKKTDQEVRAHEAAHKNTGGQYAGSASYSYTVGPDGKRYAIGGEVPIDVAPVEGDPEATIAKLDVVIAAALAPAKPSAQDRKVAAAAVAARNLARAELLEKEKAEENDVGETEPFDVNNFGDIPSQSVQKAYENGLGLGQENTPSGQTFSVIS